MNVSGFRGDFKCGLCLAPLTISVSYAIDSSIDNIDSNGIHGPSPELSETSREVQTTCNNCLGDLGNLSAILRYIQ